MPTLQPPGARQSAGDFILVTLVSIALNIAIHTPFRQSLLQCYPGDSIHTLSSIATAGLLTLTGAMIALLLSVSWVTTSALIGRARNHAWRKQLIYYISDVVLTLAVYAVSLNLIPQVYYTYYRLVFTGLPSQSVIKWLSPEQLYALSAIQPGASLADHIAGITGWVLLTTVSLQWLQHTRCRAYFNKSKV